MASCAAMATAHVQCRIHWQKRMTAWSPADLAASSPSCCLGPATSLCCHHSMATVAPDRRESELHRFTVPLLVALLCLVWGSTWWAIRLCLQDQRPLSWAALRFCVAGLVMAAVAPRLARLEAAPPPPRWLWITSGLTNFAGSYGLLYAAETVVPSGVAAVLWSIFPLLMAGSAVLFLGERLRARQLAGFVVSFLGILTVFSGALQS